MIPHNETSWPRSRARAQGGTIINVITILVIFGLVGYAVYWVMKKTGEAGQQYATVVVDTHHKSVNLACQMNLSALYKTIQTYAISNESLPADQQELVSFSGYGSKQFHCPDPNGGEYLYVPGSRTDSDAPRVLMYESKPVHGGKCNVLLSDGQIALVSPEELKQALEATQARRRQ